MGLEQGREIRGLWVGPANEGGRQPAAIMHAGQPHRLMNGMRRHRLGAQMNGREYVHAAQVPPVIRGPIGHAQRGRIAERGLRSHQPRNVDEPRVPEMMMSVNNVHVGPGSPGSVKDRR